MPEQVFLHSLIEKENAMKNVNVRNRKQGGFVLTAELVLIVTILVLGAIVGLVTMRDALNAEMEDVAEAIGTLDQGYCYDGLINGESTAATAGSCFVDGLDDNAGDIRQQRFIDAAARGPGDAFSTDGSQTEPVGSENNP
jgi:hypothetical protein